MYSGRPGEASLRLLVLHDDAEREFDYTAGAERALEHAGQYGWTVVSMRNDWATVFGDCDRLRSVAISALAQTADVLGSDGTTPRRARHARSPSTGSGSDPPGDQHAVRRIRRRHRLCHRRRATAGSRRLSRCARGEPAAGLDGFHRTAGPVDLRHLNQWWTWTPGACWHHPRGPRSSLRKRRGPSRRACRLRGRRGVCRRGPGSRCRPRRSGRWPPAAGWTGAAYTWGDEPERPGQRLANYWHGEFPYLPDTGYGRTAPVGSFPPTATACSTWRATCGSGPPTGTARHPRDQPCCAADSYDPAQPQFQIRRKVIKGGSFLCADNYCLRYRPAARRPQMVDTGHEPHRFSLRITNRTWEDVIVKDGGTPTRATGRCGWRIECSARATPPWCGFPGGSAMLNLWTDPSLPFVPFVEALAVEKAGPVGQARYRTVRSGNPYTAFGRADGRPAGGDGCGRSRHCGFLGVSEGAR